MSFKTRVPYQGTPVGPGSSPARVPDPTPALRRNMETELRSLQNRANQFQDYTQRQQAIDELTDKISQANQVADLRSFSKTLDTALQIGGEMYVDYQKNQGLKFIDTNREQLDELNLAELAKKQRDQELNDKAVELSKNTQNYGIIHAIKQLSGHKRDVVYQYLFGKIGEKYLPSFWDFYRSAPRPANDEPEFIAVMEEFRQASLKEFAELPPAYRAKYLEPGVQKAEAQIIKQWRDENNRVLSEKDSNDNLTIFRQTRDINQYLKSEASVLQPRNNSWQPKLFNGAWETLMNNIKGMIVTGEINSIDEIIKLGKQTIQGQVGSKGEALVFWDDNGEKIIGHHASKGAELIQYFKDHQVQEFRNQRNLETMEQDALNKTIQQELMELAKSSPDGLLDPEAVKNLPSVQRYIDMYGSEPSALSIATSRNRDQKVRKYKQDLVDALSLRLDLTRQTLKDIAGEDAQFYFNNLNRVTSIEQSRKEAGIVDRIAEVHGEVDTVMNLGPDSNKTVDRGAVKAEAANRFISYLNLLQTQMDLQSAGMEAAKRVRDEIKAGATDQNSVFFQGPLKNFPKITQSNPQAVQARDALIQKARAEVHAINQAAKQYGSAAMDQKGLFGSLELLMKNAEQLRTTGTYDNKLLDYAVHQFGLNGRTHALQRALGAYGETFSFNVPKETLPRRVHRKLSLGTTMQKVRETHGILNNDPMPVLPTSNVTSDGYSPIASAQNLSPEERAWLRTIRFAEGTDKRNGYSIMFGGGTFDNNGPHPNRVVKTSGYASAAAGAYQFMPNTWNMLGGGAMTPRRQDEYALKLIINRGVNPKKPLDRNSLNKLAPEWASLPTLNGRSYYNQPVKSYNVLFNYYQRALEQERRNQQLYSGQII